MRALARTICLAVLLALAAGGAAAQELLSAERFSAAVIEELQSQAPDFKVSRVGPLHLKVEDAEGGAFQMFLDNAYRKYRAAPGAEAEIIAEHVASILETQARESRPVDPARVVPVIKDNAFIPETRLGALQGGGAQQAWNDPAHERYNAELVILYAEDTELNIRYLSEEELENIGFTREDRRARAVENLKALLPGVQAQGGDGTFMLSAGGNYEASLLLFDRMWQSGQLPVKGELVVAVPARDVLVVTGSEDPAGLEIMRDIIADVMSSGSYTLTDRLFVYRDGRFVVFEG